MSCETRENCYVSLCHVKGSVHKYIFIPYTSFRTVEKVWGGMWKNRRWSEQWITVSSKNGWQHPKIRWIDPWKFLWALKLQLGSKKLTKKVSITFFLNFKKLKIWSKMLQNLWNRSNKMFLFFWDVEGHPETLQLLSMVFNTHFTYWST